MLRCDLLIQLTLLHNAVYMCNLLFFHVREQNDDDEHDDDDDFV